MSSAQFQIPQLLQARDLMSSPVHTVRLETTIAEALRLLLRYGHSGLPVVNAQSYLAGIISRRDIDIAIHYGFSAAPVKGHMTTNLKTISPDLTLPEIQSLMATYNSSRLLVLENGLLLGIVTRTDVLRALKYSSLLPVLQIEPSANPFSELLSRASLQAEKKGWHLYLVGGAVRDLLLAKRGNGAIAIPDIDLVVDGFHQAADVGAGVQLAQALQELYPSARLEIHGAFQTAALEWDKDEALGSLSVDLATARTEFYPYPAANPEVEASSIHQDLYRRDFTINALAVKLTSPNAGEILDLFGGLQDLSARQIRVLHANSFIEDPTRIYRAVRFAVRLGFEIEPQTQEYIRYAISSGIFDYPEASQPRPALQTRLKAELKYILQAPYWQMALQLLNDLGALKCIHPTLELDEQVWRQLRLLERGLSRFDPQHSLDRWLLRLEVLIAHVEVKARTLVAKNLHLPLDSIQQLEALERLQAEVKNLPDVPSQVVQLLRQYDSITLILVALPNQRIRRQIWQYFTHWANVQPLLNGNDLKALGYEPGPQFKQILAQLLVATLDGVISDRTTAVAFVTKKYPSAPLLPTAEARKHQGKL